VGMECINSKGNVEMESLRILKEHPHLDKFFGIKGNRYELMYCKNCKLYFLYPLRGSIIKCPQCKEEEQRIKIASEFAVRGPYNVFGVKVE